LVVEDVDSYAKGPIRLVTPESLVCSGVCLIWFGNSISRIPTRLKLSCDLDSNALSPPFIVIVDLIIIVNSFVVNDVSSRQRLPAWTKMRTET